MSLFTSLRGITGSLFQIGGSTGPNLKNNSGVIEARNAIDTTFTIVRGTTPVNNNDLTTKQYVDTLTNGVLHEIRYAITNAATQDSTTLIPGAAQVALARLVVTTPYSGGATISIGQMGSIALLQATTDNLATVANTYNVEQDTAWGGIDLAIRTTINGTPAAGAGFVIVFYCVPNG